MISRRVVILITGMTVVNLFSVCPTFAYYWHTYNGHSYALTSGQSWSACEAEAVAAGGHLATINDAAENQWIVTTLGPIADRGMWIGFTDQNVEGEWRWIDGESSIWQDPDNFASPVQTAYTNWAAEEPNDRGGEDYAFIYMTPIQTIGMWCDVSNGYYSYNGIIEVVPEPASLSLLALGGLALIRRKRR